MKALLAKGDGEEEKKQCLHMRDSRMPSFQIIGNRISLGIPLFICTFAMRSVKACRVGRLCQNCINESWHGEDYTQRGS